MDLQPTLTGPRLRLRPLAADDYDALYAVAADPLLWDQHPAKRYRPEVYAEFFAQSLASGGCLVVELRDGGSVIGTSRFKPLPGDFVEIGWTVLARAYWGGDYNRELKSLMVAHLTAHGKRGVLNVAGGNHRSARAAGKVGGRLATEDYYPELVDERPGYRSYVLPEVISPP